jgi:hypothetical protein
MSRAITPHKGMLEGLVADRDKRESLNQYSRAFMAECWRDDQVVAQLSRFYDRCC